MYKTPSQLPEAARARVATTLNERLADGLDLHSQIKVAHWNIRGPQFPSLHPLFEEFATQLALRNDEIAERAVTLGGHATGTARQVAKSSRIPEYPAETSRDLDHVQALADRIDVYLEGVRISRGIAEQHGDIGTSDLLNALLTEFEKNAWFLRATLA
ncbi:MAG: DNA starvation/stationary phase protection protein Dps [Deltaproteobacteria bacterium]|nr:DNA starvation/stationary phase protection protein Dps [Deltaproteobacteria bacterium]